MNVIEAQVQRFWRLSLAWKRGVNAKGMTIGGALEELGSLRCTANQRLFSRVIETTQEVIEDRECTPLEVSGTVMQLRLASKTNNDGPRIESSQPLLQAQ